MQSSAQRASREETRESLSISNIDLGMAIPWRISFLEESRSQGMANLHSSGIEEDEIYSWGSSRNFEELYALKFTEKLPVY